VWNARDEQLDIVNEAEAQKAFAAGIPVFRVGEEIELKGIKWIVADIAPAQIKLKPKKPQNG